MRRNMVCTHCHPISIIVKIDLFIDHSWFLAQSHLQCQCMFDSTTFFFLLLHTSSFCYLISWEFALCAISLSNFFFYRLEVKCVWFRFFSVSVCVCVCVRICIQSKCQIEMRLMVKGGTLNINILSASIFRIFTLLNKPIRK